MILQTTKENIDVKKCVSWRKGRLVQRADAAVFPERPAAAGGAAAHRAVSGRDGGHGQKNG